MAQASVRPNWQVSLGRFTIFLPSGTVGQVAFKALTGSSASQTNTQGQVATESGLFAGSQLTVQNQGARIDILFAPAPSPSLQGVPLIGAFPNAIQQFFGALPGWSAAMPPVIRMAVGLQLMEPANSVHSANLRLRAFVPQLGLDLSTASDFLLQINYPKPSKTRTTIDINRLSKLQVVQLQQVLITPTGIQTGIAAVAAGMEIDVSTPADNLADLKGPGFDALVTELTDIAINLGNTGPV